jgi:c-di-GMP-binding flagellar brake protein YcgR
VKGFPEQGQQVFVIAPSGAGIAARVIKGDPKQTLLSFEENETNPVPALAGGNLAIQYTNRRGVCRVDGAAHRATGVTMLRVDHTSKVQLIQRREFVRVDAMLPVTYRPIGVTGWTAETTTINVSGGGFMISGREALRLDQIMEFTVTLDGEGKEAGPLDVVGQVAREMPGGLGISITQIDERERERLIRWVFARERQGMLIVKGGV